MLDKYAVGQDTYCYPGTDVLCKRFGLNPGPQHREQRHLPL